MVDRRKLDHAINQPTPLGSFICLECMGAHYLEEVSKYKKPIHTFEAECSSCGERAECVSNSVWQSLVYPGKSLQELVRIFTEHTAYDLNWATVEGVYKRPSPAFREIVSRGVKTLPSLYFHISRTDFPTDAGTLNQTRLGWLRLLQKIKSPA